MKRLLLFLLVVLPLIFVGCSKDDEDQQIITNSSGFTWYDTQVWFRSADGEKLSGYKDVGMIQMGEVCTVSTSEPAFYIYGKNARGKMIMSKDVRFVNGKASVSADDWITK